jgi:hypothetical protein
MAAPLAVAVVHLPVRLEILSPQVKSGCPKAVLFGCGQQAALCNSSSGIDVLAEVYAAL